MRSILPSLIIFGLAANIAVARAEVTMVGPALRACSGITGNAQPMHPQSPSSPDCQRLPGAALYNQAGSAFQSGDHQRAAALATQAAKAGNPLAQLRLAMLYEGRSSRDHLPQFRAAYSLAAGTSRQGGYARS